MKKIIPLLVPIVFALAGCATVTSGTKQDITFTSNPPGVEVYEKTMFGDKLLGVTPATLPIDKGIGKVMIFKKAGFQDHVVVMQAKVNSASYGNAANLMVGDAVDVLTGAKYEYKDDQVFVALQRSESEANK